MDFSNAQGAPLMAAVLVLVAVAIISGVSIAFSGSIQF